MMDGDTVFEPSTVRELVQPFGDPGIGAVSGNAKVGNRDTLIGAWQHIEYVLGHNLDRRMYDMLGIIPTIPGAVGAFRKEALQAVGGMSDDTLAEDTDMTFRLILAGWEVVYQNRSECYEEVPESWPSRIRQIQRWARGHNQSLARYWWPLLQRPAHLRRRAMIDGLLLLGVFAVGPLLLLGWIIAVTLYYMGAQLSGGIFAILAVAMYSTLGNFAAFFEADPASASPGPPPSTCPPKPSRIAERTFSAKV